MRMARLADHGPASYPASLILYLHEGKGGTGPSRNPSQGIENKWIPKDLQHTGLLINALPRWDYEREETLI
jgi:hypothetical protein